MIAHSDTRDEVGTRVSKFSLETKETLNTDEKKKGKQRAEFMHVELRVLLTWQAAYDVACYASKSLTVLSLVI